MIHSCTRICNSKNTSLLRLHPACQWPACTRVSPPLTWADKHMYVNGAVLLLSERAKWTLWLVAATKLVCPLLPGRSCGGSNKKSWWDHRGKRMR